MNGLCSNDAVFFGSLPARTLDQPKVLLTVMMAFGRAFVIPTRRFHNFLKVIRAGQKVGMASILVPAISGPCIVVTKPICLAVIEFSHWYDLTP